MIQEDFWPYIDAHCPEPEAVKELELPPELEGLSEEVKG